MRDSSNSALFWKRSAVYPHRVCNLLIVREDEQNGSTALLVCEDSCLRAVRPTFHSRAGGNPQGLDAGSESETTHLSLL